MHLHGSLVRLLALFSLLLGVLLHPVSSRSLESSEELLAPHVGSEAGLETEIPKIIHQSWKVGETPPHVRNWQKSWRDLHPDWTIVLWTDEANRALVQKHYSWLLPFYDSFSAAHPVLNADFCRLLYMHQYGGVYADLDFQALKPMDEMFRNYPGSAYLANQSTDPNFRDNISNAWMASVKGHPFWLYSIVETIRQTSSNPHRRPEDLTGPVIFFNSAINYRDLKAKDEPELTLLAPGLIYPIDWRFQTSPCTIGDVQRFEYALQNPCTDIHPESYAITYWQHGWSRRFRRLIELFR